MKDSRRLRLTWKKGRWSMGKSARVLGWEFGRTAREMNELLKQHGYLDGTPGAYGLTEKGQRYAQDHYHSRGTGGYAHYNRNWETRTWNDETAAAIKTDMETSTGKVVNSDPRYVPLPVNAHPDTEENTVGHEPILVCGCSGDDDPQPGWAELAVGGAVIGALYLAPHVKPFWNKTVRPAAKKLRNRLTKQERSSPPTPDASGAPNPADHTQPLSRRTRDSSTDDLTSQPLPTSDDE